jgi:DNA polymerase III epsilon subunit-like protein
MKYLFIDTETTGLPLDDSFSIDAINNWPRLVSVAYILCDDRKIVRGNCSIIKPIGFIIPPESTRVHGITSAEAISKGRVLSEVLDEIKGVINECDYIVGHNVVFDINVLNAEFFRDNMTLPVSLKPYYCTMLLSKDYCGLPNDKYPTLEELYSILKGESIANAHNAMTDAHASMECFWILKDSGIVGTKVEKPTIKIYPTEDNISWAAKQVSTEYAAKAYAYLTFASNLLYNKSNFLKSEEDDDYSFFDRYLDSFSRIDDSILKRFDDKTRKEFEYYSKDCRCAKNTNNRDWLNSMFNFF